MNRIANNENVPTPAAGPVTIREILVSRGVSPDEIHRTIDSMAFPWYGRVFKRLRLLFPGDPFVRESRLIDEIANCSSGHQIEEVLHFYRNDRTRTSSLGAEIFGVAPRRARFFRFYKDLKSQTRRDSGVPPENPTRQHRAASVPWTYTIDTDRNAMLVTKSGVLTGEELVSGVRKATGDPRFHPGMRIFLDYQGVTKLQFSVDTAESMARLRAYSPNSRRAFLVSSESHAGFFKYYKGVAETGRVEVFTERAQALAWLNDGVPAEKFIR